MYYNKISIKALASKATIANKIFSTSKRLNINIIVIFYSHIAFIRANVNVIAIAITYNNIKAIISSINIVLYIKRNIFT